MAAKELSPDVVLDVYLNDHLAGASGGADLFRRVARTHADPDVRAAVGRRAEEVAEDRLALLDIMRRLGVEPSRSKVLMGRTAERLGRLKPNGSLVRRSNLTDLIELEALMLGV